MKPCVTCGADVPAGILQCAGCIRQDVIKWKESHAMKPDQTTAITLEAWRAAGARTLARLDELSAHYATVYGVNVEQQQERARAFVRAWEVQSPIEEVRQAIEERENSAGNLVDVPFSLTAPVSERRGFQKPLF